MSGSQSSQSNAGPATPPTGSYERWIVAAIATLGGIISLAWLFWLVVPEAKGSAADWSTLAKLCVAILLAAAITAMLRFALAPLSRGRVPSGPATSPTQTSDPDAAERRWITPVVFGVGSGAIILLALGLILAFSLLAINNKELQSKIDTLLSGIFSTVLPIFATWVGTVIAFYFTSANFQQAAKIARDATYRSPQPSVLGRMIPYDKIAKIEIPRAEARGIPMSEVVKLFTPPVTRVIIFDRATKQPVFIIRQKRVLSAMNNVDDYLKQSVEDRSNAEDAAQFDFIPTTATLDDARAKMTSSRCLDLFVTADGQKTQPVLGWLTDDSVK